MKRCSKCNIEKPIPSFYRDVNAKSGVRSSCKKCDIDRSSKWNKGNKDLRVLNQKKWRELNRQNSRDQRNKYAHTDKGMAARKKWNQDNPDYHKNKSKEFRSKNPGYASHYAKLRKKQIKIATPPWLTTDQLKKIRDLYIKSRQLTDSTGIIHHVDHISPLKGDCSCGLHVPWNLQILTAEDNLKKGNKLYE